MNSEFISELWNIFLVETNDIRLVVPDAVLSYNLQLLTKHEISLFSRNGGNAFGITEDEGPLFRKSKGCNQEMGKILVLMLKSF